MAPRRAGSGNMADTPETLLGKEFPPSRSPSRAVNNPREWWCSFSFSGEYTTGLKTELEAERAGVLRQVVLTPQPSCRGRACLLLQLLLADGCRPWPSPCWVSPRLVLRSYVPFQACPSSTH